MASAISHQRGLPIRLFGRLLSAIIFHFFFSSYYFYYYFWNITKDVVLLKLQYNEFVLSQNPKYISSFTFWIKKKKRVIMFEFFHCWSWMVTIYMYIYIYIYIFFFFLFFFFLREREVCNQTGSSSIVKAIFANSLVIWLGIKKTAWLAITW